MFHSCRCKRTVRFSFCRSFVLCTFEQRFFLRWNFVSKRHSTSIRFFDAFVRANQHVFSTFQFVSGIAFPRTPITQRHDSSKLTSNFPRRARLRFADLLQQKTIFLSSVKQLLFFWSLRRLLEETSSFKTRSTFRLASHFFSVARAFFVLFFPELSQRYGVTPTKSHSSKELDHTVNLRKPSAVGTIKSPLALNAMRVSNLSTPTPSESNEASNGSKGNTNAPLCPNSRST